jgi:hypothetical protein
MIQIRIIKPVRPGVSPTWVGLVLPALDEKVTDMYIVHFKTALEILGRKDPQSARFLREFFFREFLFFPSGVCELLPIPDLVATESRCDA